MLLELEFVVFRTAALRGTTAPPTQSNRPDAQARGTREAKPAGQASPSSGAPAQPVGCPFLLASLDQLLQGLKSCPQVLDLRSLLCVLLRELGDLPRLLLNERVEAL